MGGAEILKFTQGGSYRLAPALLHYVVVKQNKFKKIAEQVSYKKKQ